jgi:hypothetical protein
VETNQTVLVGEQIAGQSAKVRKQLEQIISKVNSSSFDIAELLYTIKKNGYYEGFTTFSEFTKTLAIKPRKAQYLTRIAEVMEVVGIPRAQYEPLGTAKLREIASLDVNGSWTNPDAEKGTEPIPIKSFIVGFVDKGSEMSLEEIKNHVKTLKGLVGSEAMGWLHLYVKQSALDNTIKPALQLAKKQLGSARKDDEGISQDYSDGVAAEVIFADWLSDPANEVLAGE